MIGRLKMKSILKIFLTIFLSLTININDLFAGHLKEEHAAGIGNFLENMFSEMSPEEQESFIMEVQREHDKLMKMSPAERAQKEKEVAEQLDSLMGSDSPYQEMFTRPMPQPMATPEPKPTKPAKVEPTSTASSVGNKRAIKPAVPADLKTNSKKLAQKIIQAIDTILIKVNSMQTVQHAKWNESQWQDLKDNLQLLQAQLGSVVNSDIILAEFIKSERQSLRDDLTKFEAVISDQAKSLKTPDAMGLVVIFEGQPKVIDTTRYESAILQLQKITTNLNQQLHQKSLVKQIKNLVDKFAPTKSKPAIQKPTKAVPEPASHSDALKNCPVADPISQTELANKAVATIKQRANQDLLNLCQQFQATPNANLKRKLQWQLSELNTHLSKLISYKSNCKDLADIVSNKPADYGLLSQIANSFDTTTDSEIINLIKQIQDQIQILFSKN